MRNAVVDTNLALQNQFDLATVGNSFYQAFSSGATNLAQAQQLVTATAKLNLATGGDQSFAGASLEDTQLLLAGTINAYRVLGATFNDVNRFADILFQTTNFGAVTLKDLVSQLGDVTGVAALAGIKFEELSASVALLTKVGIRPDIAITGVKNIIDRILAPSNEAAQQINKLGLNITSITLATRGLSGVIEELTRNNVPLSAVAEIFGQEANLAIAPLIANFRDFQQIYEDISNSSGTVERAANIIANTFNSTLNSFKNAFETFSNFVGDFGRSLLEPILIAGREVFNGLTNIIRDNFDVYIAVARAAGLTIAGIIRNINGSIGNAFRGYISQIEGLASQGNDERLRSISQGLRADPSSLEYQDALQSVFNAVSKTIDVS